MPRQTKLWHELSQEEKAEEKKEFLLSYCEEAGGHPEEYEALWEEYLNQEGFTLRDELIMMKRDFEYEKSVSTKPFVDDDIPF